MVNKRAFNKAIALTGGIATGKSSIKKHLIEQGFVVIDADKIAHQSLEERKEDIIKLFGDTILDESKNIDRKRLGAIVFSDISKKKLLEAILHPLIYKKIEELSLKEEEKDKIYFIEIPLFYETNRYPIEKVIVISSSKDNQIKRVMKRDNLSKDEALKRINSQLPLKEKCKKASYCIENSSSLEELYVKIDFILKELK